MAFQEDQKSEVQQATDIVRLVGEQVSLRPRGREFIGLCPFHDDKNPSMYVSPAKQIYKCFSCGAGGDVFSFAMGYHKMTFPEALEYLAERAGIKLEKRGRGQPGSQNPDQPSERELIASANKLALEFFQTLYRHPEHGRAAREYVDRRGISREMVESFCLGYASDLWDGLEQMIRAKNWDRRGFELAGLVSPRKSGQGHYDRLRHRLIFPIFDAIGRPIAFGGRKLREEDEPKYLNSPETRLFNKSATLYGLHLAKKPIIDSRSAVIVEGYTDVIACHQAGAANVVATLGTALTAEHVRELRRYCDRVVLVFDGDEAGQKAADRAVELFLTGDLDVAIAVLPGGVDPADLLGGEGGLDAWEAAIDEATDALAYQFERVRTQLEAATTVTGRQKVAEGYLAQLGRLGLSGTGSIRRSFVVQRLSQLLHLGEDEIQRLLQNAAPRQRSADPAPPPTMDGPMPPELEAPPAPPASARQRAVEKAERQILGCLLRRGDLFVKPLSDGRALDESLPPEQVTGGAHAPLYRRVYERLCEQETYPLAELLGELAAESDTAAAALATEVEAEVERASEDDAEKLEELFVAAAEAVLNYHREQAYRESRTDMLGRARQEDDIESSARVLERVREQMRDRPSAARIPRLGPPGG
ncbi:MAG: DNA primase [Phycisphaeraceae bacterium]